IDAGSNALAQDQNNNALTTDQRGVGFSRISNGTVDIGAFEVQSATPPPSTVQFSAASYTINEGDPNGRVNITLTRSGDTTSSASVNFVTNDNAGLTNCNVFSGIASPRCDYINTLGIISFAAGETSKSFSIAIVDDSYHE